MTEHDIDALLRQAARRRRQLPGDRQLARCPAAISPLQYFGTRPEDPNDLHPHEHRRELRGLRVFSAWLNHDDSRSVTPSTC